MTTLYQVLLIYPDNQVTNDIAQRKIQFYIDNIVNYIRKFTNAEPSLGFYINNLFASHMQFYWLEFRIFAIVFIPKIKKTVSVCVTSLPNLSLPHKMSWKYFSCFLC